jgi:hypothetical protein
LDLLQFSELFEGHGESFLLDLCFLLDDFGELFIAFRCTESSAITSDE